jgi:hypothetical protein
VCITREYVATKRPVPPLLLAGHFGEPLAAVSQWLLRSPAGKLSCKWSKRLAITAVAGTFDAPLIKQEPIRDPLLPAGRRRVPGGAHMRSNQRVSSRPGEHRGAAFVAPSAALRLGRGNVVNSRVDIVDIADDATGLAQVEKIVGAQCEAEPVLRIDI